MRITRKFSDNAKRAICQESEDNGVGMTSRKYAIASPQLSGWRKQFGYIQKHTKTIKVQPEPIVEELKVLTDRTAQAVQKEIEVRKELDRLQTSLAHSLADNRRLTHENEYIKKMMMNILTKIEQEMMNWPETYHPLRLPSSSESHI